MAEYPSVSFHFEVKCGLSNFSFTEVSGLNFEAQVIEYRGGAQPEFSTLKMPGIQKTGEISMKRGVFAGDNEMFEWWNTISMNTVERRDITISLLNEAHEAVVVWTARNAFVTKLEAPSFKADGNEVAIESMTVVHEGLTVEHV